MPDIDNMDEKIEAVANMLGQDNVSDDVKDLIKSFASNSDDSENLNLGSSDSSLEVLSNAKNVIDKIQNKNDPRINLLLAIKPFLSNKRQKKVKTCVNVLRLTLLSDLFNKD